MNKKTKMVIIIVGIVVIIGIAYYYLSSASASTAALQTSTTVCQTNITSINISGTTATAVFNGPISQMQYAIDGQASGFVPVNQSISLAGLAPGAHQISMTPYCQLNGQWVGGGSASINFTV